MSQVKQEKSWSRLFGRKSVPKAAPAHVPDLVPARVLSAVEPAIPAYFLGPHVHRDQIETAFWALFTVHVDGTAEVEMTASTGHAALDALALAAARRWRFQPATQDGEPVVSYLRLKIEFDAAPPFSRRGTRKGDMQ